MLDHRGARVLTCLALVIGASTAPRQVSAQGPAPVYLKPPQTIVDILDAPPIPDAVISPSRDVVALIERRSAPVIADLAEPMLRLGGLRINPRTNGPHRNAPISGITLETTAGAAHAVTVPANSTLLPIGFSPDGKRYAFGRIGASAIELWMADVTTGKAARTGTAALNAAGASPGPFGLGFCEWLDDSSAIACLTVPANRGAVPAPPTAPEGPNVQETSGRPAPVRTYQDLLTSAHDEALFEYYLTSQLALIDPASGKVTAIGKPGMIEEPVPSPDGKFFLVSRTKRPFSRLVPRDDFPKDIEIWSRAGEKVRTIADVPMGDAVPITGVITGPRGVEWHAAAPSTLVWTEALDGGDLKNKVPHRDRLMTLAAPFTGEPSELMKTEHRFREIAWTGRGQALVTEFNRAERRTRTWLIAAASTAPANAAPRKVWDRSSEDAYADPGEPLVRPGGHALLQHGDSIYLVGKGSSPEGDRPFLDRLDLATLKTERLFHSDPKAYEAPIGVLADDGTSVLTQRESKTEVPNYFVRTLPVSGIAGPRALTSFTDPAPQLAGIGKQVIRYKRNDGLELSATIYTPAGFVPGKGAPLPTLLWAYPQEFTSAAAAAQVKGSPNRFTKINGASHLLLLTQGYAIIDNPAIPIVGPGETANDTYVEQLVAGAQAAVDAAVALGVTDRDRVGAGGHSYGAFMTGNLLAHSDIFRMGIARSGAYNRTLTPFGFQQETRTFWEVPQIYEKMSPFWYAHKINEPILLIHGEADNNSGTFPIQSERLYVALKGHGATVRYVTLPHESHTYTGRESVLHAVAEMLNWADRYLKQGAPRSAPTASALAR